MSGKIVLFPADMSQPNRIAETFAQAKSQGRACFVAYLCAGDPDFETSLAACRTALDAGVDILEIGVPFSDPLADGLTNQLAAQRALESGMTAEGVFKLVRKIREFSDTPIVFYTYYNLVYSKGEVAYAKMAKEAGADGVLVLDLPPEEAKGWLDAAAEVDLKTVFIVAPTTPEARLERICAATTGFIYYVSRTGVTGERDSVAADMGAAVDAIRKHTELPVVVGFGISRPEHVRDVAAVADGVVVGSAVVNCIGHNLENRDAILPALKNKVETLVSGLSS